MLLVALPGGTHLANALMRRLGANAASDGGDNSLLTALRWAVRVGVLAVLASIPLGVVVPVVVLWIIPARLTEGSSRCSASTAPWWRDLRVIRVRVALR